MSDGARTCGVVLVVLVATLTLCVSTALASATFVTVDDPAPAVEKVDAGGYKLSVGLTNITSDPVAVGVDSTSPKLSDGCAATVDNGATSSVPGATHDDLVLMFDAGCTEKDVNSVVLGVGPGATQKVTLTPKDPQASKPDWGHLWAFIFALGGALVIVGLLLFIWNISPVRELKNLPDTWKFSDSLVTNVTLLGGTLTGVVGSSDVVKAFLGKDADTSIALATVGAAVAAAMIGLGAVVLQTTRKNRHFTVGGLMLAAAVTLSGAYGELYVVWQNGKELTLGGWQGRLDAPVAVFALLLLAYAVVNLKETLEQGLVAAKPSPLNLSADAIAATVIASKLVGGTQPADLADEIREALKSEVDRETAELGSAETEAKPNARVPALGITPKASPARKSALI